MLDMQLENNANNASLSTARYTQRCDKEVTVGR